ncbi:acyltransferase family protein [Duganella sp. FT109W]|uniref:Acyltransferase family protein n=1 Tax=Duganella margarita TaxID=2692170 RepID=A0ABW9WML2_9BURK|nr:acyltransferase family protein [Duganella margarita]MYN42060.1 acyltransferase family protein [Duganella margarita]
MTPSQTSPAQAAQPNRKSGFQTDINGLRGVAVMLVVLYHFNLGLFKGGFIGVDIFFVISGYLMTKILWAALANDSFSYIGFIYRRAIRIWPALFAMVFMLLLLGAFLLPPADLSSLAVQSAHALVFNSNNFYAAQQGYFSSAIDNRWLLHTWSLAVEWQFYMIYPVIMLLAWQVFGGRPKRNLYLSALLLGISVASFAYCMRIDNEVSFFSVIARCWQMLAGGLVFMLTKQLPLAPQLGRACSYLGLLVVAFTVFLLKYLALESRWPDAHALLPVLGACLILYSRYEHSLVLSNRLMQKLGDASYSIYLWHWPVVIALTITGMLYEQPKLAKIAGMALSLALGYASYTLVEQLRAIKAATLRAGLVSLVTTGAMLVGASFLIVHSDGLMFRVQDQENVLRLQAADTSITLDPACSNTDSINADLFCYINKNAQGDKILVIGDSHAGHLYSWFQSHSRVNTTFFVKPGCPMIIGFERPGKYHNCHGYAEKAYQLAASGVYKTVIISQNWTGYTRQSSELCRYAGNRCTPLPAVQNALLPEQQMKQTLEAILARGVTVALVDSTPSFTFNVPRKLWRDQYWFGKPAYEFPVGDFFEKNKDYDQLFSDLTRYPQFHLLSFRPQICQEKRCRIYDADSKMAIFKDYDHFNPEWMRKNGQIFLPFTTPR